MIRYTFADIITLANTRDLCILNWCWNDLVRPHTKHTLWHSRGMKYQSFLSQRLLMLPPFFMLLWFDSRHTENKCYIPHSKLILLIHSFRQAFDNSCTLPTFDGWFFCVAILFVHFWEKCGRLLRLTSRKMVSSQMNVTNFFCLTNIYYLQLHLLRNRFNVGQKLSLYCHTNISWNRFQIDVSVGFSWIHLRSKAFSNWFCIQRCVD